MCSRSQDGRWDVLAITNWSIARLTIGRLRAGVAPVRGGSRWPDASSIDQGVIVSTIRSPAGRSVELPGFCGIRSAARILVFQLHPGSIAKIASDIRIKSDGLGIVGNRPVVVALRLVKDATVVQGAGVLGVESDGVGIVGNRPVVVAFLA